LSEPKTAVRRSPAEALWERSQTAFKRRNYPLAAELMQTLIDRWGEAAAPIGAGELRLVLGVTLMRLGRTADGVEQLKRAVALLPEHGRAHQKLGAGLARLGRHEEAMPFLRRAVVLEPDAAHNHWRLGVQLQREGLLEEARSEYARCLKLHPGHPAASRAAAELDQRLKTGLVSRIRRAVGLADR
jgi:tetratricopeptide (TPR) repeat protein